MAFKFKNPWKGGALGQLGDGILALQKAIEGVKGGNKIIVEKHADNSFTVKYGGPVARNGWNGKIYRSGTSSPIVDVDVADPLNIEAEYICVNPDTGDSEWGAEPRTDDGWSSFHVAEPWNDPNGDLPESFGQYALTADFSGSIVVGGGGFEPPLVANNVLSAEVDPENEEALAWVEGPLSIEANASGAATGFVFSKPDPSEIDAHSQMKATGGIIGDVLSRTATGSSWATPDTDPWPENSKITVVTDISGISIYINGSTMTVTIEYVRETIDFNEKTITEDGTVESKFDVVIGAECS